MGEEQIPQSAESSSDDPLYLSPDEQEQVLKYQDTHSRPEAIMFVLGSGPRYRRFVAAEARQQQQKSSQESQEARRAHAADLEAEQTQRTIELLRETDPNNVHGSNETDT
jgi:hypothetical protein